MGITIANKGFGGKVTFTNRNAGGIFRMKYSLALLLDTYSGAAAAYSLRKLRTAYSGAAIRVRRSSDNVETDIGFTSSGALDETALTTFVGANSGFVTTWYDQSGNARNATQTTAANQPRIVSAGVVDKLNSRPAVKFLAGNFMISSTNTGTGNGIKFNFAFIPYSFSQITTVNYLLYEAGTGYGILAGGNYDATITGFQSVYNNGSASTDEIINTPKLGTAMLYNTTAVWVNSSLKNTNAGSSLNASFMSIGGGIFGSTQSSYSTMPEIIFYASDQTATRTKIEQNINSYYAIY